ncbi:MAG: hypothetical protein ABIR18_15120 [Chitinophagaceae bacterium]
MIKQPKYNSKYEVRSKKYEWEDALIRTSYLVGIIVGFFYRAGVYYVTSLAGENAKDIKVICPFGPQSLLAGSTDGSKYRLQYVSIASAK